MKLVQQLKTAYNEFQQMETAETNRLWVALQQELRDTVGKGYQSYNLSDFYRRNKVGSSTPIGEGLRNRLVAEGLVLDLTTVERNQSEWMVLGWS